MNIGMVRCSIAWKKLRVQSYVQNATVSEHATCVTLRFLTRPAIEQFAPRVPFCYRLVGPRCCKEKKFPRGDCIWPRCRFALHALVASLCTARLGRLVALHGRLVALHVASCLIALGCAGYGLGHGLGYGSAMLGVMARGGDAPAMATLGCVWSRDPRYTDKP